MSSLSFKRIGPVPDRDIRIGWLLLLSVMVVAIASKSILYDTLDPDLFWHLRVAEQLTQQGIRPVVDQLSFMSIKSPWTPYSWLAELGMKGIWDAGGFRLAIAIQSIIIAAIYSLIALCCVTACGKRATSRLAVAITLLCAAYLSLPYLSFRPATAVLVTLALCIWILIRDRMSEERTKAVWLLVPLCVLMVNIHLFAVIVPLSVAALFTGALVEWYLAPVDCDGLWRCVRRYAALLALTLIACTMTPMLPGMLRTMGHYQSNDAMVAGPGIAELRPFYSGPMGWLAVLLVAASFMICWRSRDRMRSGEWFWLLGATALLFRMGRFSPLFVMIAAPIVAAAMPEMRGEVFAKPMIRFALTILLCLGLGRIVMGFPGRNASIDKWLNRHGPDTPGYPCEAAAFVEKNVRPTTGHILNDFSWGGYLAWRLGPNFQTFMDGRTQLYTPDFWRATCLGTGDDLKHFIEPIPADAAIVPIGKSELRSAVAKLGWTRVYADDRAEVYVPPASDVAGAGE